MTEPGVRLAQAEADLLFPTFHFSVKHPEYGGDYTVKLFGLKDYVSGKLRRSLIVLWCAVGLILLIVCVKRVQMGVIGKTLLLALIGIATGTVASFVITGACDFFDLSAFFAPHQMCLNPLAKPSS
jgi:hypothetical protein